MKDRHLLTVINNCCRTRALFYVLYFLLVFIFMRHIYIQGRRVVTFLCVWKIEFFAHHPFICNLLKKYLTTFFCSALTVNAIAFIIAYDLFGSSHRRLFLQRLCVLHTSHTPPPALRIYICT